MCGITGYIDRERHDQKAMLEAIHHRGPDGQGAYNVRLNDREVFLGHTRLSIIDLSSNGAQPMSAQNGSRTITYNGEVYNFEQLRQTHLAGRQFRSRTDTEVILQLFEQQGIDCLQHLNGAFAMALLDEENQKLFVVRDRMGIKPLYYAAQGDRLLFGSEIKTILAAGHPAELNQEELQRYFVFKYVPQQETLFKHIRRVPPAHYLEYDLRTGKSSLHRYWSPQNENMPSYSYDEAQEELRALLKDAVQQRLIADVPISTFLSGGLDSTIIASFLKEQSQITHYCASKNEADLKAEGSTSDFHFAQQLADEWQLNFQQIPIGSDELTDEMIDRTLYFSDDLIADGSQIPSYLITKAAGEHCKVVLTGMGADELFLGYAGHQISLMASTMQGWPGANFLNKQFARLQAGKGKFKAFKRYLFKMGKYYHRDQLRYGMYSIVGDYDSAIALCGKEDTASPILEQYFQKDLDPFKALRHFERENFLVKNLHYVDRTSMANALESRVPFLDHRIVEFAEQLPRNTMLSSQLKSKRILKDTFKKEVPTHVIQRRKAGFGMPLRALLSDRSRTEQLLSLDFFSNFNQFNVDQIKTTIDLHISGKEDQSALLYALISFRLWHQRFLG